jgi:exopolysaccharide production protein ExoY
MSAVERDPLELDPRVAGSDSFWVPTLVPGIEPTLAYQSWRRHVKRSLDIVFVSLALPVVLVPMVLLALAVKLASPGPVLFRHERIGRNGRTFAMLKFRTMYVDSAQRLAADPALHARYVANDYKLPASDDPRIAPLGRFLRRTSLDELPQLFNVLSGRMSLVGPRPIVAGELSCYGTLADSYLETRPGITGRWQCEGRNHIRYPERAMLDAEYLESWSLGQDALILLKTIPCVLRRQGSH